MSCSGQSLALLCLQIWTSNLIKVYVTRDSIGAAI